MKNIFLIFIFLGLLMTACSKEEALIDLTGEWTGEYGCAEEEFTEIVSIVHDVSTGDLVATKITGDPCIGAGETTFRGNYDGKAIRGTVIVFGRVPGTTETLQATVTMIVTDMNSINVEFPGRIVYFEKN